MQSLLLLLTDAKVAVFCLAVISYNLLLTVWKSEVRLIQLRMHQWGIGVLGKGDS